MKPSRVVGIVILAVAIAFAWTNVALAPPCAELFVVRTIGLGGAPQMVETLFTLPVFGPLIAAGLVGGAVERRNAADLGARPGAGLLVGAITGVAGLSIAVVLAALAGVLVTGSGGTVPASSLLWGAAVIAVQVAAEEIYFRGWLQPALGRRWGALPGIVAAAFAFAAVHVAGGAWGLVSLTNLFLGGLVFGLFAARAGGLAGAIGAHWAWNATEQLVWGLDPNPGLGSFGALVDKELVGRALWGGSADGLNGSVGMTLALLAILLPLATLAWPKISRSGSPG